MQIKQGTEIGSWRISRQIGKGGNGVVYKASDGVRDGAIKILTATGSKRVARFADEIKAMEKCKDLPGVLPLYGSYLTDGGPDGTSWLAMPLAVRLVDALGATPTFEEVIAAISGIAKALVAVHGLNISHRDIKPDNLFALNGQWVVGDFGLADFDGKESVTSPFEKVGPMFYIAPEMFNAASSADGKAADVYSLAKTMWVLASGQKYPLPGHQLASVDAMTISAFTGHPRAVLLDKLLENSTNFDPAQRPTMQQFLHELDAWLVEPKQNTTEDRRDMGVYKRLLEGRLRAHQESEQAAAEANQRRVSEAMRVRERFRTLGNHILQELTEVGFVTPNLSIDNYAYGFQILATVPFVPNTNNHHRIKVLLHANPNADGSHFVIEAWYSNLWLEGNETKETSIWQSKREFFSGGADEERQIISMSQSLSTELSPAIEKVLAAAGVL